MTTLFKFNVTQTDPVEHELQYNSGECRYWFWTFEVKKYYLGVFNNVMFASGETQYIGKYYYVCWNTESSFWGKDEDMYDGLIMKRICLGRLQFHWATY